MKLVTVFEKPEIQKFLYPYLVVENWRNVMTTGKGKREFATVFSIDEQEIIQKVYKTYCHWCLGRYGTGIPDKHTMTIKTFNLLSRVAIFFGKF